MKLGVAFAWHTHPWKDLLGLVQHAEELGFAAAFVDGDVTTLASKSERDVLHGWTVLTALLAHTRRIQIGSIRLVHHWNAAQLAQAVATAELLFPGRLRCVIAAGDRPNDASFGLPQLPVGERLRGEHQPNEHRIHGLAYMGRHCHGRNGLLRLRPVRWSAD
jgi:alkanesulfonate monooxygenase SsuD/methylene tetrahydromethanopterin reductase-like flavin-dependent oxidoreductase (luciferase family)